MHVLLLSLYRGKQIFSACLLLCNKAGYHHHFFFLFFLPGPPPPPPPEPPPPDFSLTDSAALLAISCLPFSLGMFSQIKYITSSLVLNSGLRGCPLSSFNCSLIRPLKCGSRDLSLGYDLFSMQNRNPLGAKTSRHSIQVGLKTAFSFGTSRPCERDFIELR